MSSTGPASGVAGIVSGTSSGTWTQRKSQGGTQVGVVAASVYDATNQSAIASETLTIGFPLCEPGVDTDVIILDIQGAAASPYDTSMGATGDQTSTISTTCPDGSGSTLTLAPSQSGGLMVGVLGVDQNYVVAGSGIVQNLHVQTTPVNAADTYGNVPTDQSDGYGIYYPTSTSSETFTWTVPSGTAVLYWEGVVVSYKPAIGTSAQPYQPWMNLAPMLAQ
jgi:hypothetical protein